MSFFSDIVALAKAGYTPDQVNKLLQEAKEMDSPIPPYTNPEPAGAAEKDPEPQPSEPENIPPAAPAGDGKSAEDEIKKLQDQINKLQSDLTAAQKANTGRDLSGRSDKDKALDDIVRSFM